MEVNIQTMSINATSNGNENIEKNTNANALTTIDCDSVYKIDNTFAQGENRGSATPELKVKLPPIGSSAYHHMVTELMSDPRINKKMKAENYSASETENSSEKLRPPFWRQFFCTPGSQSKSTKQPETIQRRTRPANMFSLLIGGGGNRQRRTQVLIGSKF